jgi:hypothetical protein
LLKEKAAKLCETSNVNNNCATTCLQSGSLTDQNTCLDVIKYCMPIADSTRNDKKFQDAMNNAMVNPSAMNNVINELSATNPNFNPCITAMTNFNPNQLNGMPKNHLRCMTPGVKKIVGNVLMATPKLTPLIPNFNAIAAKLPAC